MELKGAQRDKVIELLEQEHSVAPEAIRRVAEAARVPEADVYGVARFYDLLVRPGPRVCQGLSCLVAGAEALAGRLNTDETPHHRVSCVGQCDRAPAALGADLRVKEAGPKGRVTPDDPELPINLGGPPNDRYEALERARTIGGERVIAELKAAGLQGRGGAGFPAHIKWASVRGQAERSRHVICNADEAEPGTFKDRDVMRRRPHRMLEGLAIAAFAAGARDAWIYIRGEFPDEATAVEAALPATQAHCPDVRFHVVRGHGAYICGEETALIESIEGKRGMPRLKPPYPTEKGLFGLPTLMNNVETLACVPDIILRGGERFRGLGRTEPGTKLYCVSGHVARPGTYELPLGISLDELADVAGGYVGTPLAFSPGGASAGFLPIAERSRPLDFRGLPAAGSMLGSAGVVVLNDTIDMAWAARWQAVFFEDESCGQCAPCRIGTRYVRQTVDRYLDSGDPQRLQHVADVAWEMDEGSICGLGMTAALPVVHAMKHFPEAFGRRAPRAAGQRSTT